MATELCDNPGQTAHARLGRRAPARPIAFSECSSAKVPGPSQVFVVVVVVIVIVIVIAVSTLRIFDYDNDNEGFRSGTAAAMH